MTNEELTALCHSVSTWDQSDIDYAARQERNVHLLAHFKLNVFPLGPRWWQIRAALKAGQMKAAAIKARAE